LWKYNFTYNTSGKVTEKLSYQWSSTLSDWEKKEWTSYLYNSAGKTISTIKQVGSLSNTWVKSTRYLYTYNGSNNLVENLYQNWNSIAMSWGDNTIELKTYNANNNNATDTLKKWNITTSAWDKRQIVIYTYNAQDILETKLVREFNTTSSLWVDFSRYTYISNLYSDVLDVVYQQYATSSSVWLNYTKSEYNFDSRGNLIELKKYKTAGGSTSWSGAEDTWIQYVFNSNNQEIETFGRSGNYPYSPWISAYRITKEYDNGKVTAVDNYSSFEPMIGSFAAHRRSENQCTLINTGINDIESYIFSIYPNPVSSSSITVNSIEKANYSLIDITGKLLQKGDLNEGENRIDINLISAGVYFVRVGNQTRKIIVQ
jgi:hypothetical protein